MSETTNCLSFASLTNTTIETTDTSGIDTAIDTIDTDLSDRDYMTLADWMRDNLDGAVPSKVVKNRFVSYVAQMYRVTPDLPLAPMVPQTNAKGYTTPSVQGYYRRHSYLLHICYLRAVAAETPKVAVRVRGNQSPKITQRLRNALQ